MHKYVTYNANRREKWVGHDHEIAVTRSIRQMKNALIKWNTKDQTFRIYRLDEDTWNMILIPATMWHELFGVPFD